MRGGGQIIGGQNSNLPFLLCGRMGWQSYFSSLLSLWEIGCGFLLVTRGQWLAAAGHGLAVCGWDDKPVPVLLLFHVKGCLSVGIMRQQRVAGELKQE